MATVGQPARRLRTRNESAAAPRKWRDALFRSAPYLRAAFALRQRRALSPIRPIAECPVRRRHNLRDHHNRARLLALAPIDESYGFGCRNVERAVALRLQASGQLHTALFIWRVAWLRSGTHHARAAGQISRRKQKAVTSHPRSKIKQAQAINQTLRPT